MNPFEHGTTALAPGGLVVTTYGWVSATPWGPHDIFAYRCQVVGSVAPDSAFRFGEDRIFWGFELREIEVSS